MAIFSKGQKIILQVCGVIIVVGLIILGIDKYIVKKDEPSRDEKLAAVQAELGFELHEPYSQAGELMHISKRFEKLAPAASDIGAVMIRRSDDHELFLYEHIYQDTGIRTASQRHSMGVEVFAILFRFPGLELPDLAMLPNGQFSGDDNDLRAVMTREAAERLQTWPDFGMGTSGEFVMFIQRPPASALLANSQRNTSDEFQPGLLNSGLKIDVQRAIDITNMMNLGRERVASVYSIDTSDIKVDVEVPEIDLGMDDVVEKTNAEVDALMADFEADMEAMRAENQAHSDQLREEREAASAARKAEFDAKMEAMRAEREAQREELRQKREADQAAHEARMKAIQEESEARMREITGEGAEDSSGTEDDSNR